MKSKHNINNVIFLIIFWYNFIELAKYMNDLGKRSLRERKPPKSYDSDVPSISPRTKK